jgi:aspartyl-tRNA(Asn)/glutamyl-tRNA(Gln) amidotransferase subunit A
MTTQPQPDLTMLSLEKAAELLRTRQVSPLELTRACIDRIVQLDEKLHAFIALTAANALQRAREAEREIASGDYRGSLHGIPVALKDIIDTAGVRTTAASRVYEKRTPTEDAEVVRRLKDAGAVLVGKNNLHEFAYGCSSVVTAFGDVHNPLNHAQIAGGSSSGSAVSVATGMCYAAIGTDTAGSIRLPAAYCGVVGLKPTYGLVSAAGVIPLCWSLDHVGPITRTVRDAAMVLECLTGSKYSIGEFDPKQIRVAIAHKFFFDDLQDEVADVTATAIALIESVFGSSREVEVEIDEDRTVHKAEAFTYHRSLLETSSDLYQPQTLRRIRTGKDILAADYIDEKYHLYEMRQRCDSLFTDADIIVTPTAPIQPPTIAKLKADDINMREQELFMLRNTRPFNVLGLPTISIPCGRDPKGLPVGLQFTAAPGEELKLLQFSSICERLFQPASSR